MIHLENMTTRLNQNKKIIISFVKDISSEQAIWRPFPGTWSILEVINHLVDEEKEDFRKRLELTLHNPQEKWPSIDPPAWILEHKYNERDLKQSIQTFKQERQKTIKWLGSLEPPDFNSFYDHPILGKIRAGDLLTSWLAHDLLHIRQIAMLKAQYLEVENGPFNISYALPQF